MYPRLRDLRESLGMTQEEFGKSLDIAKSTYNNYETGIRDPKSDFWVAVATKYNTTIDYLMGFSNDPHKTSDTIKNAPLYSSEALRLAEDYDWLDEHGRKMVRIVADGEKSRIEESQARVSKIKAQREQTEMAEEITPEAHKIIDLPFDELKASAGAGYQLDEDRMTTWKVRLNDLTRKADFCLEVDGHSMEPMIYDGDIILIRQQPSVDVGEIGLFTADDKGYVKKQGKDRLISINPECEDVFPNEYDTVFCRGKVIGVLNPEWIVER